MRDIGVLTLLSFVDHNNTIATYFSLLTSRRILSDTTMTSSFPSNIHLSTHPLLRAKLSQLRSSSTTAKETKALVHDIALILGVEALGHALQSSPAQKDTTPLGYAYTTEKITPERISVMPILRSGLGMIDGA